MRADQVEPIVWNTVRSLLENPEEIFNAFRNESILNEERAKSTQGRLDFIDSAIKKLETAKKRITEAFKAEAMTLQEFRKEKTDIELSEEKLISERDGLTNKLNIQHNIEAKIDLFKETCHKFLSKINDPKIVTNRIKKDIIKLIIDEVVIDGEKLKIAATIPLPNKVHEREIVKADTPDTFNSGATLGPINQTKMERIWAKHKQLNTTLKPKVFVAMSGGVDSSVAAALLKREGYDVAGVYIRCWSDPSLIRRAGRGGCGWEDDIRDARAVADRLGIPLYVLNLEEEYRRRVVEEMLNEYAAGRTPNPDVACNREIKFGLFLQKALQMGADAVATGHYARIACPQIVNGRGDAVNYRLLAGIDANKDQSYFLWTLTQKQLRYCRFPVGEYEKADVRAMAGQFGLPTARKKDSQGVCFIGDLDVQAFLRRHLPCREGAVVTLNGTEVGRHDGAWFFTVGQREGIGVGGAGFPLYVVATDRDRNIVTVAPGNDHPALYAGGLIADNVAWTAGEEPSFPLVCAARIRYRQSLQPCVVTAADNGVRVLFDEPQRAVTSGQSIVFYAREEMLGGAVIERSFSVRSEADCLNYGQRVGAFDVRGTIERGTIEREHIVPSSVTAER